MDFSKKGIIKKQHQIKSWSRRFVSKTRVLMFRLALVVIIAVGVFGCFAAYGAAKGMIDDAPSLSHINIDPEKFTTHIYYSDGTVSGTVVGAESSRILATSEQIPKVLKDCLALLRLRTNVFTNITASTCAVLSALWRPVLKQVLKQVIFSVSAAVQSPSSF